MRRVELASEIDFEGWRAGARALRAAGVPPQEAAFRVAGSASELFADPAPAALDAPASRVPRTFVDLASRAVLHRAPHRFDLLYRLYWRLRDTPRLMEDAVDADVAAARDLARNVDRAAHKMKAFVRFRALPSDPGAFAAWFEPAHRVTEAVAPFFVRRFASQRFALMTPDACARWDGETLAFAPGARREDAPAGDDLEEAWRTYYAATFNPARLKVAAMQGEMPKRYWRNLPEAELIPDMVAEARRRSETMVKAAPTEPSRYAEKAIRRRARDGAYDEAFAPDSAAEVWPAVQACRRCDLWRDATQGVAGEGPARARLMIVGEQPGDQEDLAGHPFVGPAGRLLDEALQAAGIDRETVYVTNAVKHFKNEPRGKRRLHRTPSVGEVTACRWWLDHERRLVRPRVVLALGATAARAVTGRAASVTRERGSPIALEDGATALLTFHPAYLLRLPDRQAAARARDLFVADLAAAARIAADG